jgi:hypothetical protein
MVTEWAGVGSMFRKRRQLLRFLEAGGSRLGNGARGRAEEEARREGAARDWRHSSQAAVAASGVGACDGVERV